MNSALKLACLMSEPSLLASINATKSALFHSTPVLDRKSRTHWDSGGGSFRYSSKRSSNYSKRHKRMHAKHALLRNVNVYAECLFQSWKDGDGFADPYSNKDASWFGRQHSTEGAKRKGFCSQEPRREIYENRGKSGFRFCYGDDEEVETIIRSAFGGGRFSYWSFINDDYYEWRDSSSSTGNHRKSWKWRNEREYESYDYDSHEEYQESKLELTSERLVLGMSASGPLKLEDIKSAYRACALKWHPDRHQGSSKAVAEEKFKLCSAAYQSLCDKLEDSDGAAYC
ncbi:hypothetical protein Sjap_002079 [Stephania japonica]|uniref:J domain-containing protein n=1 Tax=Stephania japonica TaxID=461633 RepID=A0AAP0PU57_9MAGN